MAEKIYPKGLRTFAKRQGSPNFVLGAMVVTPEELQEWISVNQQHLTEYQGKKQLRLDILQGKDGPYVVVNTYKPQVSEAPQEPKGDLPF